MTPVPTIANVLAMMFLPVDANRQGKAAAAFAWRDMSDADRDKPGSADIPSALETLRWRIGRRSLQFRNRKRCCPIFQPKRFKSGRDVRAPRIIKFCLSMKIDNPP
ncbi:hypothetical protein GCM10007874_13600 [Labrys miyagiensis]|uniref:Uncharacterized protein n=1 Tax=Labrys miyagiensis TaxID=346912 RepID=A0ABQ6CDJ7_9HYPH|nr:hypothetical protein GCM10007874_13600 [Labrys miyagiensis]